MLLGYNYAGSGLFWGTLNDTGVSSPIAGITFSNQIGVLLASIGSVGNMNINVFYIKCALDSNRSKHKFFKFPLQILLLKPDRHLFFYAL